MSVSRPRRQVAIAAVVAVLFTLSACAGGGRRGQAPSAEKSATIKRDEYGVPHVYAEDVYGLFYAYAYALAEDRLFQLEMMKRSLNGTVAEVLGPGTDNAYIEFDKSARSNLRPELIRTQLEALAGADKDIFDGYAAGINARIQDVLAARDALMPKQFNDFDFTPTPWTAYDAAVIWVGSAAGRYSDSNAEVSNLALLTNLQTKHGAALGKAIFDQVRWANDPLAPTTVPTADAVKSATRSPAKPRRWIAHTAANGVQKYIGDTHLTQLRPVSPLVQEALRQQEFSKHGGAGPDFVPKASNAWIAAPARSVEGKTVFINGPQQGFTNPSYVTGAGLHGAGFDVVGNTPLGWPYLVFATNGAIVWGATAGPLDVVDMYQERLNPANQYQYLHNGAYRNMAKRTELINVKGAAPVSYDIYTTVHGLVTAFDVENGVSYAKKRSWEGIEVQSLLAYINSMKAKTWDEFVAASAPIGISNNRYYADKNGNIGYISVGKLPLRAAAQDFRLPADGIGSMEWQGFKAISANPQVLNPKQGFLTNWNNQPSPSAGSTDAIYWSPVDRVNEFNVQFATKTKFTVDELWRFNEVTSFMDVDFRYFRPFIETAIQTLPGSSEIKQAGRLMANWDGMAVDSTKSGFYDSPAVTIFRTWLTGMIQRTLQADIPGQDWRMFSNPGIGTSNTMGTKITYNALLGASAGVPQLFDFFHGTDKYQVVRDALTDAVGQLKSRFGADMSQWRTATRAHVFSAENFLGIPQADAGEQRSFRPAQNRGTENHRVTFDSAGNIEICDVAPPGQSGFVAPSGTASPHYQDQLGLYEGFGCKPQWIRKADVDAHAKSEKTLIYSR